MLGKKKILFKGIASKNYGIIASGEVEWKHYNRLNSPKSNGNISNLNDNYEVYHKS